MKINLLNLFDFSLTSLPPTMLLSEQAESGFTDFIHATKTLVNKFKKYDNNIILNKNPRYDI